MASNLPAHSWRLIRRRRHSHATSDAIAYAIAETECAIIAQSLQKDGFGVTSSRILSDVVTEALKLKMPDLFRGEFETGVYPDEWHWR